jgi:protein involved in polysaccharide export with SLBB domain
VVRLDKKTFQSSVYPIDLEKLFSGDESQNMILLPSDRIYVSSDFKPQATIEVQGEFKLPGIYVIRKNETLSSVISRAGGFTDDAYLFGAVFTRRSAADMQDAALNRFVNDMEKNIMEQETSLMVNAIGDAAANKKMNSLEKQKDQIEQLKESVLIKGRVILKLAPLSQFAGSQDDIILEDGDVITVGKRSNIVTVLGEVYSPSSVIFKTKSNGNYYLKKVGGLTGNADKDHIYVVRADGSVISGGSVFSAVLDPGDVIFVPQILDKSDFWANVKSFTEIFYQTALGLAVILTYLKQ